MTTTTALKMFASAFLMAAGCSLIMPLDESEAMEGLHATSGELVSALLEGLDSNDGLGFDYIGGCTADGDININSDLNWQQIQAGLSAELAGCSDGDIVVDGTVAVELSANAVTGQVVGVASGELWFTEAIVGWCEIDVALTVDVRGVSYAGTLCGHDAADLGPALLTDMVDQLKHALPAL